MIRKTLLACAAAIAFSAPVSAQDQPPSPLSYSDLVSLSDGAALVIRAEVRKQAEVERERAPGLAPGHARLYLEARTQTLIAGSVAVGEDLRYLVDVPLGENGKAPKLKRQEVVLFARPVAGRPGEIQLIDSSSQLPYSPELEARLRPILSDLASPEAPPVVIGISDAFAVEGALVGESETQLFLDTRNDGPVSVTIVRRPGQAPRWGVSWTEIVDQAARPPQPGTLEWYRLSCSLPAELPGTANLSRDSRSRALAERDYAFVIEQLGSCGRTRG